MKKVVIFSLIFLMMNSCSISFEKRRYRPGYHIDMVKNNERNGMKNTYIENVTPIKEVKNDKASLTDTIQKHEEFTFAKPGHKYVKEKAIYLKETINGREDRKKNEHIFKKYQFKKSILDTEDENLNRKKLIAWILGGVAVLFFVLIFVFLFIYIFLSFSFIPLCLGFAIAALIVRFTKPSEKARLKKEEKEKKKNDPIDKRYRRGVTLSWVFGILAILLVLTAIILIAVIKGLDGVVYFIFFLLGALVAAVIAIILRVVAEKNKKLDVETKEKIQQENIDPELDPQYVKKRKIIKWFVIVFSIVILVATAVLWFYILFGSIPFIFLGITSLILGITYKAKRLKETDRKKEKRRKIGKWVYWGLAIFFMILAVILFVINVIPFLPLLDVITFMIITSLVAISLQFFIAGLLNAV